MKYWYDITIVCALVSAAILCLGLAGCNPAPTENPKSIGVVNPDPKDPLYGVTLENEAQNLDRIKAATGLKKK